MMRSLLVLALLAGTAHANVGAPTYGGSIPGEGTGLSNITITREQLTIDMRALAQEREGLVTVAATYHLDNHGDAATLDLVFSSGERGITKFAVTLDGAALPFKLSTSPLPESWKAPFSTPGFSGGEIGYERFGQTAPYGFTLDLPPGKHDLAITYAADALTHHMGDPTLVRQLVYVLAPARTWGGFGGLDLTIHVPAGWRAAVTPHVTRNGDTLTGTYSTLPADAIGISVQAQSTLYSVVNVALLILFAIVVFGGGFGVAWWSRRKGTLATLADALARGLVYAFLVGVSGFVAIFAPAGVLPAAQVDHRGYGAAFAAFGVIVLSFICMIVGTVIARRSGAPRA